MNPLSLKGFCQSYEWGKKGRESLVAQLQCVEPGTETDAKPYAELWFGTHPSGPTSVIGNPKDKQTTGTLKEALQGKELPYLLKVLSVGKALSIQAHPDKDLAERLHLAKPDLYKDANHKPEMCIALTDFELLCSFRPLEEISEHLDAVPELLDVVGKGPKEALKAGHPGALRSAFTALVTAPKSAISAAVTALVARLSGEDSLLAENVRSGSGDLCRLVLRLHKQFGQDVGVLCAYFLNYMTLKPGQALFLGPNEPHAYLSGDCIECMACSDNVVRAGLTPKPIDVETLTTMLTYKPGKPQMLAPIERELCNGGLLRQFISPVWEFSIAEIKIPTSGTQCKLPWSSKPRIILPIQGEGVVGTIPFGRGEGIFVPQGDYTMECNAHPTWLFVAGASPTTEEIQAC